MRGKSSPAGCGGKIKKKERKKPTPKTPPKQRLDFVTEQSLQQGAKPLVYGLGGIKQSSTISGPGSSAVKIADETACTFFGFFSKSRGAGSVLYTWLQEKCLVLSGD